MDDFVMEGEGDDELILDDAGNEFDWQVNDLLDSNSYYNKPPPTDENIIALLHTFEDEWCPDSVHESDLLLWSSKRFCPNLSISDITFEVLEKGYKSRVGQLMHIHNFMRQSPMLCEDMEQKDKVLRIANCMKAAYDTYWHASLLASRMDPLGHCRIPNEVRDLENIFNFNKDKLTNQQKLIIHITKLLEVNGYRKVENQCWVQIMTPEDEDGGGNFPTQAWTQVKEKGKGGGPVDLHKYINKVIQKEIDFEHWLCLTNPIDNTNKIVNYLVENEHDNFPSLIVDRHKWSYKNGIYDINTDTFWKYDEHEFWNKQAEAIQEYRRLHGWGAQYSVRPPNGEQMSVKYFDQPFRFDITPETEEDFDASNIVLPEVEKILEAQNLTTETQSWVLIMLARLFFKVKEKDRWQVVFFIKGVAGSGKSTIAQFIRHMYPPNLITTLASNVEPKFGLSAIYKGLICICAEVRADFGLDQADWQSACSGEDMSIAIKNKTAISHLWDTPFFFLGNEVPNYKNASGSVDRRIFMIEFNYKVRGSDPQLFDKMIENIDLFHRKSVSLYLATIRKYGDKDIWSSTPNILPQQIWDFKINMRSSVDCLYNFITSPSFDVDPSYEIPERQFLELYNAHRKASNEGRIKWNREHYLSTFYELGLDIIVKETTTANGKKETLRIITGVCQKNVNENE